MLQIIKAAGKAANEAASIRVSYFKEGKNVDRSILFDQTTYDALIARQLEVENLEGADYLAKYNAIVVAVEGLLDTQTTQQYTLGYGNFVEHKGYNYMLINGVRGSVPVPTSFIKLFETKYEESPVNATALLKFWMRFSRNQTLRKRSFQEIVRFATNIVEYITKQVLDTVYYDKLVEEGYTAEKARVEAMVPEVKITSQGLLQTYKVVNVLWDRMKYKYVLNEDGKVSSVLRDAFTRVVDENTGKVTIEGVDDLKSEEYVFEPALMRQGGDAFFCGDKEGHDVRVGSVIKLENWDKVNCNLGSTCVKGLHLGGLSYIKGFESQGTETLNCFVDPMNIGFCGGASVEVLRVLEYYPVSIKNREANNKGFYNASSYASMTDADWNTYRNAIITENAELLKKISEKITGEQDILNSL